MESSKIKAPSGRPQEGRRRWVEGVGTGMMEIKEVGEFCPLRGLRMSSVRVQPHPTHTLFARVTAQCRFDLLQVRTAPGRGNFGWFRISSGSESSPAIPRYLQTSCRSGRYFSLAREWVSLLMPRRESRPGRCNHAEISGDSVLPRSRSILQPMHGR